MTPDERAEILSQAKIYRIDMRQIDGVNYNGVITFNFSCDNPRDLETFIAATEAAIDFRVKNYSRTHIGNGVHTYFIYSTGEDFGAFSNEVDRIFAKSEIIDEVATDRTVMAEMNDRIFFDLKEHALTCEVAELDPISHGLPAALQNTAERSYG